MSDDSGRGATMGPGAPQSPGGPAGATRRRSRLRAASWGLVALLVAAGLGVGAYAAWNSLHSEQTAPDFTLTSTGFENGTQGAPVVFNLTDYRGQTVLLDFMGVTCSSCRILTDQVLFPLHERYGNRTDFVIVSVDVWAGRFGETEEELIKLQQSEGTPWRHALDTDNVFTKYKTYELPKITVIDPAGRIVFDGIGIPPLGRVDAAVQESFVGQAEAVPVLTVGILGLAFIAGVASVFSPCSIGLLPAYLGFLLRDDPAEARLRRERRAIAGGLATTGGIVTVYAAIAVLLAVFGSALRPYVPLLAPVVAVLLIVLGILMFAGFDWSILTRRIGVGQADGRRGFFVFGIGYGTAAFGCTGPVFVPILLAAFLEGTLTGVAAFALYTVAVAAVVITAAILVAAGRRSALNAIQARTAVISKISAALLVAAGAYLLWFSWTSNRGFLL